MATVLARCAIAICLLAAAVEVILGCTSTARLTPVDTIIVLFVIGPYCLLSVLAWWQRARTAVSWGLLAVTIALSAWGLYLFGEDSYRYHTDPDYRVVQRMTAFMVPLVQWSVVLAVGFGLLVLRLLSRPRAMSDAEPGAPADGGRDAGFS
jgi:hypothetical protein